MPILKIELSDPAYQELEQRAQRQNRPIETVAQNALHEFLHLPKKETVESSPKRRSRTLERQAIIHREAEAWRALPQPVRDRYGSEFVAVHHGEVVDHDPDRLVLYRRVREQFGSRPILITPAHAPIPREFQILSPRIVDNR